MVWYTLVISCSLLWKNVIYRCFPYDKKHSYVSFPEDDNIKNMVSNVLVAKQTQLSCWESVTTTTVSQFDEVRKTMAYTEAKDLVNPSRILAKLNDQNGGLLWKCIWKANPTALPLLKLALVQRGWYSMFKTFDSTVLLIFRISFEFILRSFWEDQIWLRTWLCEDEWSCG